MKRKTRDILLSILLLVFAVLGNPIYQMVSFIWSDVQGYSAYVSTNVTQVERLPFVVVLVVIFIVRLLIYMMIFHLLGKIKPFKHPVDFILIFLKKHLYQCIGFLTLILWMNELEGNIIGFFVAPITLVLGAIVSGITIFRITRIPKAWKELNV